MFYFLFLVVSDFRFKFLGVGTADKLLVWIGMFSIRNRCLFISQKIRYSEISGNSRLALSIAATP